MQTPILLDTNLALLYVVGSTKRAYVAKHKRLQAYSAEDYDWIRREVDSAGALVLCPNVVSETSNLIDHINNPARDQIITIFARIVAHAEERYIRSVAATARKEYARLGVTDAVLLILSETGAKLITADLQLALAAQRQGSDVTNYNHIRDNRLT